MRTHTPLGQDEWPASASPAFGRNADPIGFAVDPIRSLESDRRMKRALSVDIPFYRAGCGKPTGVCFRPLPGVLYQHQVAALVCDGELWAMSVVYSHSTFGHPAYFSSFSLKNSTYRSTGCPSGNCSRSRTVHSTPSLSAFSFSRKPNFG